MKTIFHTARLIVREFTLDDADFIIELLNTEGWLQFIGDRKVHTVEEAQAYIQNSLFKSYLSHNFGFWLVMLKDSLEPVGMCGIIKRDTLPHIDIGFAFLPAHTGKGYAQEVAEATLDCAFKVFQASDVVAIVLPTNLRSISLLEKIGLVYEKIFSFEHSQEELMLFSISKSSYLGI